MLRSNPRTSTGRSRSKKRSSAIEVVPKGRTERRNRRLHRLGRRELFRDELYLVDWENYLCEQEARLMAPTQTVRGMQTTTEPNLIEQPLDFSLILGGPIYQL